MGRLTRALPAAAAAAAMAVAVRDLVKVAEACGVEHPGLVDTGSADILDGRTAATARLMTATAPPGRQRPALPRRTGIIDPCGRC